MYRMNGRIRYSECGLDNKLTPAGLINYYRGNKLVLINRDPTPYEKKADLVIHDSIGKVLGAVEV